MAKKTIEAEAVNPTTAKGAEAASENQAVNGTDPAPIDLSTPKIQSAISQGKTLIGEGKSKADAARAIFAAISDEPKDVIVAAFVEGATLTPKGALTYWYNNRRKAAKASKDA